MMTSIMKLNQNEVVMTTKFLEKVQLDKAAQGILCYKDAEGNLNYQLYSPRHFTYIMSMMERVKIDLLTWESRL